ncbi:chemotaxis protein CheB [Pontibacter flavimaris]|uniref:protein-glutamate methylesterase n=1 Tax=Pontibacter flavimaris TaxID=1797110 RepID=A0A1Q5PGH2_9BACT|nr:chemotaxis protein CheB [Pontibacter flavimaris]OKL41340.1 chemotaxis response regulator protein-glutamate methylesterase [Pontibacter flavimaris]
MEEKDTMLRVLIADSSSYSRMVLQDIIGSAPGVQITDLAADGDELLKSLKANRAELVVLDHDLPKNGNLLALKRIFGEVPVPVLLLLQQEQLTLELLKQAVELGVYGVVLKPGKSRYYTNYRSIAREVLQKVMAVRQSNLHDAQLRYEVLQQEVVEWNETPAALSAKATSETVIVIGASTGGTQAVEHIVRQLSPDLEATVLVALHLPQSFTRTYAERLQAQTPLKVVEGRRGLKLKPGKVIVAPGGRNMVVQTVMGNRANLMIAFSDEKTSLFDQPSIDLLMQSVARSSVRQVVGVILTGMGKDGTAGAAHIKACGGIVVAQDEETSTIFGMAKSAIESGYINEVLPLQEIPVFLNKYVAGQQVSTTDGTYEIERTGV